MNTQTLQLLQQTTEHITNQRQQAYLVGGSLRNLLLGLPSSDWDILTTGDAPSLARQLANKLGGHYAHMHEKASRVIIPSEEGAEIILDISPLKGQTLEHDLHQRDFTINAMAAPLDEVVRYIVNSWSPQDPHKGGLYMSHPFLNRFWFPQELMRKLRGGGQAKREPDPHKGGLYSSHPFLNRFPNKFQGGSIDFDSPPFDDENVVTPLVEARLKLIDPVHGLADIQACRLKAVDSDVFRHDPLRMLRAVRLMARYHLSIDPWTEGLLMRDSSLLLQVAPERIHDELYAILEPEGATEQLHFLDAHGLLTILMPEFMPARGMRQPRPHYWDVLEHSLQSVGKLEELAKLLYQTPDEIQQSPLEVSQHNYLAEIQKLLQEAEQQNIFQRAMLSTPRMKIAALLHDIGKPATYSEDEEGHIHFYGHPLAGVPLAQQVMRRIHASTSDRRLVQQVTAHHMRPGHLAQLAVVSPRAIRRYFVDLGATGITIALLSLADHLATWGPLFATPAKDNDAAISSWQQHLAVVHLLLTQYIQQRQRILPPQLISAEELMRHLKLKAGPKVGLLLEAVAEAQAEGAISSKEEALWLAEEKYHHMQ